MRWQQWLALYGFITFRSLCFFVGRYGNSEKALGLRQKSTTCRYDSRGVTSLGVLLKFIGVQFA